MTAHDHLESLVVAWQKMAPSANLTIWIRTDCGEHKWNVSVRDHSLHDYLDICGPSLALALENAWQATVEKIQSHRDIAARIIREQGLLDDEFRRLQEGPRTTSPLPEGK